jgi:hypothetical protein
MLAAFPTFAVSVLFCFWDTCRRARLARLRRERALRQRVAYMLWVMATQEG